MGHQIGKCDTKITWKKGFTLFSLHRKHPFQDKGKSFGIIIHLNPKINHSQKAMPQTQYLCLNRLFRY